MKKLLIFVIVTILALVGFLLWNNTKNSKPDSHQQIIKQMTMQITSPAFLDNQPIPSKYTCDGDGVNPPLEFKDIPSGAKTLALIVDDPDAPVGTWTHWVMWNIATTTSAILENSAPAEAVQGKTSSGQNVYGGPCPPSGTHHYFFKLFALDDKLTIPSYSTVDKLVESMNGHIIGQAQLVGLYSRTK